MLQRRVNLNDVIAVLVEWEAQCPEDRSQTVEDIVNFMDRMQKWEYMNNLINKSISVATNDKWVS